MTPENKPLVETASLEELNEAFRQLNQSYRNGCTRYARLAGQSAETALYADFEDTMSAAERHPDKCIYPLFMRQYLGFGVVPSYVSQIAHPHPDSSDGKIPGVLGPAQRGAVAKNVGAALSGFHAVMRSAAKEWGNYTVGKEKGNYFDVTKLDPTFEGMLSWLLQSDDTPPPVKPECFTGMSDEQIRDAIIERFSALDQVPLKTIRDGNSLEFSMPNSPIPIVIDHQFEGGDESTEKFNIPLAAVAWGMGPAGVAIMGRGDTPIGCFLKRTIGIAGEAARKMAILNDAAHQHAPAIVADYDRAPIRKSLELQKYWLRTAACAELILGNRRNYDAYANILNLLGESSPRFNFKSANKAAVVLYSIAERLEQIQRDVKSHPNPDARDREALRIVDTERSGMPLMEAIAIAKTLAIDLADAGKLTEKLLVAAKRKVNKPEDMPAYEEKRKQIFIQQQARVEAVMASKAEYKTAVDALGEYAHALRTYSNFNEDVMYCVDRTVEFCEQHVPLRKEDLRGPLNRTHGP